MGEGKGGGGPHESSRLHPPPQETVSQYEKEGLVEKGRGGRVEKI